MLGGMPPRRLVTTPHVSAGSAYPQVNPVLVNFETFLAAQSARRDGNDSIEVCAFDLHGRALPVSAAIQVATYFSFPRPVAVMR